ncbi:MAG TPA: hypothetical protein VK662_06065, partial [Acidothermaceae bacterium]|nr:hypothetical protein [Acidothermaceae bacterium]
MGTADTSPGAPQDEFLQVYGVDDEGRIALQIWFDLDDIDAALAELDAVHARLEAERSPARRPFGGREIPSTPMPPETPTAEPDTACVRAIRRMDAAVDGEAWDEAEHEFATEVSLESHRKIVGFPRVLLSPSQWISDVVRSARDMGGVRHRHEVVAMRGERLVLTRLKMSTEDANPGAPEDEMLQLFGLDDEGRIALHVWFDLEDIDAAIAELDAVHARFEEGRPQARRLENTASRLYERFKVCYAARDWSTVSEMLADDLLSEDRRHPINSGVRQGRDALIAEISALAEVGIDLTTEVVATRGERLVLSRIRTAGRDQGPDGFGSVDLDVLELGVDGRFVARIVFDVDDFDAAIAELDARYLAGEAAAYSRTWSVIAEGHAALNRRELPPTTPDCVSIDHRRGAAFAPGDLIEYFRAGWELGQDIRTYVEVVHRLSELGAVCTHAGHGVSHEGFDAEWHGVDLLTVEGDMVNRCEAFDDADLDAAIARFDQLSKPTPLLENTASRANARLIAYANARDWDSAASILADDHYSDDRRRVTGAGTRRGAAADIENFRVVADLGSNITVEVVATRGDRLVLTRNVVEIGDKQQPFIAEFLGVVETNLDGRVAAVVELDLEDIDAAFAELDARYAAGEAAADAHTWSAVTNCYAAVNRREIPATKTNFVNLDHRKGTPFAPGDVVAYTRASWSQVPDITYRIETVHQLNDLGTVITHTVRGTSHEGFEAEWREIHLMTVAGDLFARSELFDEADLAAALARFDQVGRPAQRLENAASQAFQRVEAYIAARDWDGVAEIAAGNFSVDDRRRVVNAGIRYGRDAAIRESQSLADVGFTLTTVGVVATRGARLALVRVRASVSDRDVILNDAPNLVEIDADGRIVAIVVFDPDNFEAAIAELDARYLAGEAAPYSRTWSVIAGGHAALNRHEVPPTTPDCVSIDHRRGAGFAPGDLIEYFRAGWELGQDIRTYVEVVHRLSELGAV